MMNILQSNKLLRYTALSIPAVLGGSVALLYYNRVQKLDHPVMQRAMKVLESDKRVVDFCGENIKAGNWIKKSIDRKEGTIKYSFKVSGGSGKLKTVVNADHALHGSLKIFNEELDEHIQKKNAQEPGYDIKDFEDNWPIDLEEYDMPSQTLFNKFKNAEQMDDIKLEKITDDEKIWRIKSLRVSVDEDTRILLLPLPESKREKKLIDTRYTLQDYADLYNRWVDHEEKYSKASMGDYKRFEDKTIDEVQEDIKNKRRKQFQMMTKIRKYQFGTILFCMFVYLFAWKHIAPKPVLNSLVYHQALEILKENSLVKKKVGGYFQVMSCHGRIYPLFTDISFDLVTEGTKGKAKFRVKSKFLTDKSVWLIDDIFMLAKNDNQTYKI